MYRGCFIKNVNFKIESSSGKKIGRARANFQVLLENVGHFNIDSVLRHICCHTGWSINNRTILNCSHFLVRRYFSNPFSTKGSIHIGKLPHQHEFASASFVVLFRSHFVLPHHVDGSVNNVLCRGGHFCEIAGVGTSA